MYLKRHEYSHMTVFYAIIFTKCMALWSSALSVASTSHSLMLLDFFFFVPLSLISFILYGGEKEVKRNLTKKPEVLVSLSYTEV